MKIRFMCLRHYCDINLEGDDLEIRKLQGDETYIVDTPTLVANADGTYDFCLTRFYCPEYDSLTQSEINRLRDLGIADRNKALQNIYDKHICSDTWTVVLYNNFTPIGAPKKEN